MLVFRGGTSKFQMLSSTSRSTKSCIQAFQPILEVEITQRMASQVQPTPTTLTLQTRLSRNFSQHMLGFVPDFWETRRFMSRTLTHFFGDFHFITLIFCLQLRVEKQRDLQLRENTPSGGGFRRSQQHTGTAKRLIFNNVGAL